MDNPQIHDNIRTKCQMNQIAAHPLNQAILAEYTKNDPSLSTWVSAVVAGKDLEPAGFHNNELSLHEGCIFRGSRVIIPQNLQK